MICPNSKCKSRNIAQKQKTIPSGDLMTWKECRDCQKIWELCKNGQPQGKGGWRPNLGRKKKTDIGEKLNLYFDPEAAAILKKQSNKSKFASDAVKEKAKRDKLT